MYLCVCIDMEVECRVIDVHVSVWRDVCVCVCVCVLKERRLWRERRRCAHERLDGFVYNRKRL